MWSRQHYNALAKEIREQWTFAYKAKTAGIDETDLLGGNGYLAVRECLTLLALSLAKRFAADNPSFDPYKFLDACSPDPVRFPLSEFWEVDE